MKRSMPKVSIGRLCRLFGRTPQAYYKRVKLHDLQSQREEAIVEIVKSYRTKMKRIGTVKLQHLINKGPWDIEIGRDALYNLLRSRHLLVRQARKYRPKMTDGDGNSIYPDLRKGMKVEKVNQLWCTDITYLELSKPGEFCYLTCFCDEASHLIIGHELSSRMQSRDIIRGLERAIKSQLPTGQDSFLNTLIIHSDRGSQFKSKLYEQTTNKYGIKRSMSAAGNSHENPVAERLNGILKNELMVKSKFQSIEEAKLHVNEAILIYNDIRPHLSCNLMTPHEAHINGEGQLKRLWRQRIKRNKSTNSSNNENHQLGLVIN